MVFGGKDEDNEKLNDLWVFDFKSLTWSCLQPNNPTEDVGVPLPRSGHTASIYGKYMIIFGGILDVCKELDDMIIFDLERKKWVSLFEELMLSPIKLKYGNLMNKNNKDEHYTLSDPQPMSPTS